MHAFDLELYSEETTHSTVGLCLLFLQYLKLTKSGVIFEKGIHGKKLRVKIYSPAQERGPQSTVLSFTHVLTDCCLSVKYTMTIEKVTKFVTYGNQISKGGGAVL